MAIAGVFIAILSPILGAIADRTGRRKPWIGGLSLVAAIGCLMLWFVEPNSDSITYALIVVTIATITAELAQVFYNAMLPSVAPAGWVGRLSGWGWATGYLGGLACLVVALFGLIMTETPFFGLLGTEAQENVRAAAPLAGVWYLIFAIPMFLFTPDAPAKEATLVTAVRDGFRTLGNTLQTLHHHKQVLRFLIASAVYRDGLITLFAFGGIYAAGTFGMDSSEIIMFAIALNVTAALGAFGLSWLDDLIGAKATILMTLACLMALGLPLILISDPLWFWILAIALGTFIGPAQAAGRSMLARLAPPTVITEMYGLYNLSGKAVSFIGPVLFGLATEAFQTQRAGMATILLTFGAGFALMLLVRETPPSSAPRAQGNSRID